MKDKKIGFYCWAGPTTIEMIKTKYFNPKIDEKSLMHSYDYDYLAKVKETFGITDFWATLYWGFGETQEKQAEEFLLKRIPNFQKLDIKLHGYIQGTNLVHKDFEDKDLWARGAFNEKILYYKDRLVTCPNNPEFKELHRERVRNATQFDLDGIYIDNIQMGQLSIDSEGKPLTFCGCNCIHCQKKFKDKYGIELPTNFDSIPQTVLEKYIEFRTNSITTWISDTKKFAKNKELGTNFYDPSIDSKISYGFDDVKLAKIQDYILYEHFAFPTIQTPYIPSVKKEILDLNKPIFSLPYKKPIGYDQGYTQMDYDLLESTYKNNDLNLCIKGSEFITKNVWHNLNINNFSTPEVINVTPIAARSKNSSYKVLKLIPFRFRNRLYSIFINLIMNNRLFRPMIGLIYKIVIR